MLLQILKSLYIYLNFAIFQQNLHRKKKERERDENESEKLM